MVKGEDRATLLNSFSSLSSKELQDSFLAGLIIVFNVSRRRQRKYESIFNNNSYKYKVFAKNGGEDFVIVCFQAFISIFGIKKGRVETIKRSLSATGEPPKDDRGTHKNRPRKLTDDLRQRIRDHIKSFRGRQSHYSQEKTRRLYLPEDLNINRMFNMFLIQYPESKLCYESYRTIFNNDFNISFGYPRTDTCSKCDDLKVKIEIISKDILSVKSDSEELKFKLKELEIERDVHHRKAETFYRRKREARRKAMQDVTFAAIAFDFNKNLNVPNNSSNDFYYRRKLSFFSFNIHVLSNKDVFIYGYDKTVAKKGADEVTSMLLDLFMTHLSPAVRHLELFCDSCPGQNKNYTIIRFLDYLIQHKKRFDSIKISFPERGHSYLECDKDIGLVNCKTLANVPSAWIESLVNCKTLANVPSDWIESLVNCKTLANVPSDWIESLVKNARQNPTPFDVIELEQTMIKGITDLVKPLYKAGCPIPTRPLPEVLFSVGAPGEMSHRDSWNGIFLKTTINTNLRINKKVGTILEPLNLYTEKLSFSVAKFKDLQVLKKFTNRSEFFYSLPQENKTDEHEHDDLD